MATAATLAGAEGKIWARKAHPAVVLPLQAREVQRQQHKSRGTGLTSPTGGRQEANPPHRQGPARHRRCFPRGDQGEAQHPTRGPLRRPSPGHQGEQGQEERRRRRQEGREGQARRRLQGPGPTNQQAGCQGRPVQAQAYQPLSRGWGTVVVEKMGEWSPWFLCLSPAGSSTISGAWNAIGRIDS